MSLLHNNGSSARCSPHAVDLGSLSAQQLSQVKKQLDDEVQHLTNSYQNLRAAQQKFRDCVASIKKGVAENAQGMRQRRRTCGHCWSTTSNELC